MGRRRKQTLPAVPGATGPRSSLDEYEVRYWFWRDPASCVRDPRAQEVIRKADHPFRLGVFTVNFPTAEDEERVRRKHMRQVSSRVIERLGKKQVVSDSFIKDQEIARAEATAQAEIEQQRSIAKQKFFTQQSKTWWQDVADHIHGHGLPIQCAERLADYFSGYLLVPSREPVQSAKNWRKLKRIFGADIPSVNAPQCEPLRNTLLRLMADEIVKTRRPKPSREVALSIIGKLWSEVLGENRPKIDSLRRIDRRSRCRVRQRRSGKRIAPAS